MPEHYMGKDPWGEGARRKNTFNMGNIHVRGVAKKPNVRGKRVSPEGGVHVTFSWRNGGRGPPHEGGPNAKGVPHVMVSLLNVTCVRGPGGGGARSTM